MIEAKKEGTLLSGVEQGLIIFWLKGEALKESANLPAPEIIAADLEAAMEQWSSSQPSQKT